MYCPKCGRENRPAARFCAACATLLAQAPEQIMLLQGRYKIARPLDRGGTDTIYLAQDTWQDDQRVAVRELRTDLLLEPERAEAIDGFRNQVETLAGLKHVNLPVVLNYFSLEYREYIVMELVSGRYLSETLDDNPDPLPEKQVIAWAKQLCDVLSYLHSQEPPIIHRDVKPNSIILTDDNIIKLVDFGISRRFKAGLKRDTDILGTPGYAPPEQYGRAQTDVRSDIYALGITLYVLLSKYNPSDSNFDLPPLRSLNPAVSVEAEAVIHKAIRFAPEDRFQSATQMRDALVTGNLEFLERHPSWYVWEREIRQFLQRNGRVRVTDLTSVPDNFRSVVAKRYIELHPEQDISYSVDFDEVWLPRSQVWQVISTHWQNARRSLRKCTKGTGHSTTLQSLARPSIEDDIEEVIGRLQELILLEKAKDKVGRGCLSVYYLNVRPILSEVRIAQTLPLVVLQSPTLSEAALEDLRYILGPKAKRASRIALLLLFLDGRSLENTRQLLDAKMRQVYAYNVIPLAGDELFQIATAKDPRRVFRSIILSQVDLIAISPFVITGPTSEHNFFGREQEMQTIAEQATSASFTVIGGRRIGKSSLLGRLHKVRLPAAGLNTIYYDCSITPTYETFLAAPIRDWQPKPPSNAPFTFRDLLQAPPGGKPLVLLLDEADKLIPADRAHNWLLFNTLRAFASSGQGQVVLCGERTLREALQDAKGPLFNFANEIILGPLDFRAVEELVTRPMRQLEIELEEEAQIVKCIWEFTSGHPNVVQRLCRRLVERLNEENVRRIRPSDVDAIIEDPGFQRDDFLSTYWEAATPLEKIISLLMADNDYVRTLSTIRNALTERCDLHPKAMEVDDALQRLVDLRSILERTPSGYEFAVQAFPHVVAGSMTLDDMLEISTEEYRGQSK